MRPSPIWIIVSLAPFLAGRSAAAQDAGRCTGTLCDFYYGGSPSETSASGAPAAQTPVTVPTSGFLGRLFGGAAQPAAPAAASGTPAVAGAPPKLAVQGGGLIGVMNGAPAGRCTGTLCDLYYGGPPPEEPGPAAVAPGDAPESAVEQPRVSSRRRAAEEAEPRCASAPGDPWRCYR